MDENVPKYDFAGLIVSHLKLVNSEAMPAGNHPAVIRDVLDLKDGQHWAVKFEFMDTTGNDNRPIQGWQKFTKDGIRQLQKTL